MSDIVERLRARHHRRADVTVISGNLGRDLDDAADEIERLSGVQDEVDRLRRLVDNARLYAHANSLFTGGFMMDDTTALIDVLTAIAADAKVGRWVRENKPVDVLATTDMPCHRGATTYRQGALAAGETT